ncbi:metalloregulator ArsR/SmtB family transcription factor [Georgenia sp. 10Sc9-8]|uniref:Metalloregulator ArsR/SmtB family transcription factor n=1 Tax=Georgenia halotolerans TaxID=3028317 RepID=A0ABT5TYJ3_9MICO|nr:metalloregulator ArsR/SmtB family transcription factor [Georgenia halotolerans]
MSTALTLTDVATACCTPLRSAPLGAAEAGRLSAIFKAVADPARLRLLSIIAAHEGAEACVCDLTELVGLSQPTVSHHMRVLTDAGLVVREKRGRWAYYAIVPGALEALGAVLLEQGTAGRPARPSGDAAPSTSGNATPAAS